MPKVELVYEPSCPNVGEAREELSRALAKLKLPLRWKEWNVNDPRTPERVRRFGSPTILVDGRDVAGLEPQTAGASCRVYRDPNGARGAPSLDMIVSALAAAPRFAPSLAMLPAIATSILPNVSCAACWPAYAGVLGSLGLGFLLERTYLLPLTAAFLTVALGALAHRARTRRGYGPLVLGAAASAVVLFGKFGLSSDPLMYLGAALLIAASVWNSWPRAVCHREAA